MASAAQAGVALEAGAGAGFERVGGQGHQVVERAAAEQRLHAGAGLGVSIESLVDPQAPAPLTLPAGTGDWLADTDATGMVVLHHVVGDGSEGELAEAVRVLGRNGVLILLGLNRMGWRYRTQGSHRRLPGIAPFKVKDRLERLEMTMQGFAGAGIAGRRRPAFMAQGLAGLAAPVADIVLLQARHRDSPELTPLRFRKRSSGVVQSASIGG